MGMLSLLLWTPALGVLVLSFIPSQKTSLIRIIANSFAVLALLFSLGILGRYDTETSGLQFAEFLPIHASSTSVYALGIDGLSLPMLLLACLLTVIALLASFSVNERVKAYHICLLMLEFGMLGVFLAQDWALFYIFWEATLIPLFFLIDRWGGTRRHAASLNFVLYTMGGSVFMLVSLLYISQYDVEHAGSLMVSVAQIAQTMPANEQFWVFMGFLIGFGVKMPIFPLHGWLPLAHVEAPSPVSILLSGILLKMGAYGLLRTAMMMPDALQSAQTLLLVLALVSMIYGGLLAWRQSDLKAMIAYSSISHLGLVLLGIASLTELGMMGAVMQMTAHGLIAGALFLLVGLLYERTHTRDIQDYRNLIQVMPRFAVFMTLALLAAMGLPSTAGFIAELQILIGGFQQWGGWMVLFSVSMLISAAYCIRTVGLLFTGHSNPAMHKIEDLTVPEMVAASVLALGILWFGLLPESLLNLSLASIKALNQPPL